LLLMLLLLCCKLLLYKLLLLAMVSFESLAICRQQLLVEQAGACLFCGWESTCGHCFAAHYLRPSIASPECSVNISNLIYFLQNGLAVCYALVGAKEKLQRSHTGAFTGFRPYLSPIPRSVGQYK